MSAAERGGCGPGPPPDPLSYHSGVALRFMDSLVLLGEAERAAIRPAADPAAYEQALALVRRALHEAGGGTGDRHPTGGAEQFAARADRHLDMLGITGDLWELARSAVRAILVWQVPGAELAARVVYRPFEDAIPYLRIQ